MVHPPPTASRHAREGGIALLLVLLLSLILLPFAAEFAYQVDLEARTARNVTDQLKIENALDGQFEIMLSRLRYDAGDGETDTLSDSWNDDELRERREDDVNVALTTYVTDEKSKLNLRMLGEGSEERRKVFKERLARLLVEFRRETPFEMSSGEAETWANQIAEYIGKGPMRANIPTPRTVDNRPILVLDELEFLPEVQGNRISFLLHDQRHEGKTAPGLHRYVTIYGDGRLNLNTASAVVVRAYFGVNPELAERIVERRESPPEEEEGTSTGGSMSQEDPASGNPYTDVNQVNEVEGVTPKVLEDNKVSPVEDFDVASNFFSMRIVAETQITRRDELFVVERVPGQSEEEAVEGFRFLLRQERTDPLEALDEEE
ncbi:MAG: hypothetical protein ACYTG6_03095 [Planctomycetota bacterium]|jgi:type II secretory pathway component PulK